MTLSLLPSLSSLCARPLRAVAPALALFALAAAPASSQVIVDDFEDGMFGPGEFVFSGGENGVLSTTDQTPDGSSFAAQFAVDADQYGGFTGFGQPIDGGSLDVSGIENGVLVFDAAATGTFTLEINLQNTGGGDQGEIRNALRFVGADGTYQRYRLPLASFFTTNTATFETDDVAQYVWTVVDAVGDGNNETNETLLRLDNVQVESGLSFESDVVAYDFDSGDYSDPFFTFSGGEGIVVAATTDTPDGSANALSGMIDGDEYGGFAGLGGPVANSPYDATSQSSLNFFLRTNGAAILEVNLQTVQGNGENEARERIKIGDTEGEYVRYSIPLEALIQSGANAPDFSQVVNFVFTFVELPGDGDPATTEFDFAIDAVGFGTQGEAVANETLPEVFAAAPSVFPNPTAGNATVTFELAAASDVSVDVLDLLGRRVAEVAQETRTAGPVRLGVPTEGLANGLYIVRVRTGQGVASTRLVVTR